jgi:hypothetical protein
MAGRFQFQPWSWYIKYPFQKTLLMKNIYFLFLQAGSNLLVGCKSDDSIPVDDRLLGQSVNFSHINPRTGESYKPNDDRPYNEFQDFYRTNMTLELDIESTKLRSSAIRL